MLPRGRDVGLEQDVSGVGLEDDVATEAAAQAVGALAFDGEVGAGCAGFLEGIDVEVGVGDAEGGADDPVLVGMKIITEVEVAGVLLAIGLALGLFTEEIDVPGVGVLVIAERAEGVGVEAVIEVGGEESGRVGVDDGLAAVGIGVRVGVVVVEEDAGGEMGREAVADAGGDVCRGIVRLGGRGVGPSGSWWAR